MPPLCETTDTLPTGRSSSSSATLADNAVRSARLTMPIVFGPSKRIVAGRLAQLRLARGALGVDLRIAARQHDRRTRASLG